MAKYEFTYRIFKDNKKVFESSSQVSLTKKDISELEKFVIEHNYSPEFVDVPTKIFDKCLDKAYETACKEYSELSDYSELNEEINIDLEEFIPVSFINLLSEPTREIYFSQSPYYVMDDVESTKPDNISNEILEQAFQTQETSKPQRLESIQEYSKQEFVTSQQLTFGDSVEMCNKQAQSKQIEPNITPCKENTLYLPIKQIYFDQIVAGTKKQEYREIKPTTYTRYLECDKYGNPYFNLSLMDEDDPLCGEISVWNNGIYPYFPKENYQFLNLAVGYNKNRDTAIVEIEDISFEPMLDKFGQPYRFTVHDDQTEISKTGEYCLWLIVYHLGKVIDLQRAKKLE